PLDSIAQSNDIDVELVPVGQRGWVDPEEIEKRLRPDTVVVSTMHANNETGVIQPLEEIATVLGDHVAYWHVDAAQTYGKLDGLGNRRIDLISMSGHKLYGPMGVGALVARRRGYQRPPLSPLMFGGGQERGLRPGTVPVPLVVGMGEACRLATIEQASRAAACRTQRTQVTDALSQFCPQLNGDQNKTLPHVLSVSIPELDAEAAMMILRDLVAISNGSACTSSSYEPSHVLAAMGLGSERAQGALRISWSHEPMGIDWGSVTQRLSDALR
ncbi:MAG: aminotransferase class V-fold PLP-dependent enzyme, partial [Acidimicrobiaceae bacterium]|nr:aminotransferase class V-fold PLP-dependent enzyme [Acidimicrobiaceae bacterium]